jgi:hypothetical protein
MISITEKKNRANREETASHSPQSPDTNKVPFQAPTSPPKQQTESIEEGNVPSWRRSGSFRNRGLDIEAANAISASMYIYLSLSNIELRHKR